MSREGQLLASTKQCPRCGEWKLGADFGIRGEYLRSYCIACVRAYHAAWRKKNHRRSTFRVDQGETLGRATHNWEDWTGPQVEIAIREDLTAKEAALMLGRTLSAVMHIRRLHKVDPRKQSLAGVIRGEL